MKRKLAFFLVLLMAAEMTACGGTGETGGTTTASEITTEAPKAEYDFGDLDFGGGEFTFLSMIQGTMYNRIDVENMDGDLLNDAVWKRNDYVEELYNVDIVSITAASGDVNVMLRNSVMAGDDTYDVAYCRTDTMGSFINEGLLQNLNDGSGFQFDKPWWDQAIIGDAAVGSSKAIYFASSDLNLTSFEGTWCLYFNKRMCEDLGLELPYETVKEGKWTLDALYSYISAAANLNGDESWDFNAQGSCVYGFTSMTDFVMQMYSSCDEKPIDLVDGEPVLKAGSERFYAVTDKILKVFGEEGTMHFCANNRTSGDHYENIYAAGRAFFTGAEIKGGDGGGAFSEMTDDYGIVPMPKYDEAQGNYISPVAVYSFLMTVPKTNTDMERTSKLLDAMSYLSYRDIIPIYYDVVLQTKNIRDEETRDMLDIIRDTRTYLTCYAFGWGKTLRGRLSSMVRNGENTAASIVASQQEAIELELAAAMEIFDGAAEAK